MPIFIMVMRKPFSARSSTMSKSRILLYLLASLCVLIHTAGVVWEQGFISMMSAHSRYVFVKIGKKAVSQKYLDSHHLPPSNMQGMI